MSLHENIVATPGGKPVLLVTRTFEAPPALVFRCYTDPAHLAHFWGPRDATTRTTISALEPGGVWDTRWTYADGAQYGYTSVYLEITAPERIVYRDAPKGWQGGMAGLPPIEMETTIALSDEGERTVVRVTVVFANLAARDEAARQGFATMVGIGNDRLAEYLSTLHKEA